MIKSKSHFPRVNLKFLLVIPILYISCTKSPANSPAIIPSSSNPVITSISVNSGTVGDTVTITGSNFNANPDSNIVQFNGVTAVVYTASLTTLVVIVPAGTSTGNVTVTVDGKISDNNPTFTINAANIYIAGTKVSQGLSIGAYFRNGIENDIVISNKQTDVRGIYVTGTSIYLAGDFITNGISVATFWKNGMATALTNGTQNGIAYAIFASGNDIYVAGHDGDTAKLWKNGVAINLTDGATYSVGVSLFVSGSDVYVAGTVGNIPTYWKNGVAVSLPYSGNAFISSIFVSGNDVYTAGYQQNNSNIYLATYWKNGVAFNLTNGMDNEKASSIFVQGNDVYVAGSGYSLLNPSVAKYWKNGVEFALSDSTQPTGTFGIYALNNNVYTAGIEGSPTVAFSGYWMNVTPVEISGLTGVTAMFIQPGK
jgi:hypothetical protein